MSYTVAIDVGGTSIRAAIADGTGRIRSRREAPTPPPGSPVACRAVLADLLTGLFPDAPATPSAVGICVPGTLDPATGVMGYASNLGLTDAPIRAWVEELVDVPVSAHRDGVALAAAECTQGSAQGFRDALVIGLGTGVAAGSLVDGALRGISRPRAGELGHAPGGVGAEPCTCGGHGCAEAYVGAAAICRRYRQRTGQRRSAREVIAASVAGDVGAIAVVDDAVAALAHVVAGYVATMDPALVVLGGGLSQAGDVLLRPLRAQLAALLPWRPPPQVVASRFGADGGLVGAALLAMQPDRVAEGI